MDTWSILTMGIATNEHPSTHSLTLSIFAGSSWGLLPATSTLNHHSSSLCGFTSVFLLLEVSEYFLNMQGRVHGSNGRPVIGYLSIFCHASHLRLSRSPQTPQPHRQHCENDASRLALDPLALIETTHSKHAPSCTGYKIGCLNERTVQMLTERFKVTMAPEECENYVHSLINDSFVSFRYPLFFSSHSP